MESIRRAFFAWEWPFMKKEGSLFSSACDAMDRSGRELPGEIGTTHFLILGREEGGKKSSGSQTFLPWKALPGRS